MRSKTDRLYRLWALAAVYFCLVLAFYGVSFWLPQILQQLSHYRRASSRSSLPCRTSLGPWAWSSSAPGRNPTGERRWHVAGAALLGAAGFAAPATVPPSVVLSITALSVAAFGLCDAMGRSGPCRRHSCAVERRPGRAESPPGGPSRGGAHDDPRPRAARGRRNISAAGRLIILNRD